ncbi:MAG: outer membrane protein transport protein [Bacteroidales bacterium]|nr:outer membrane protein transport protein [Bacteroidales bacterium]
MKKLLIPIIGFVCLTPMVSGGGIVTNTNQSASWVRMLVRDASTGIDAVYFNPAGLVRLENGFHFSLNSQTILQNKDVTDDYQFLKSSPKEYLGDVKAPVFPSFYAVWKTGKLAVSFGFNPVGGGGGAEYQEGLPSFESQVADLVPRLKEPMTLMDLTLSADPPAGYGFDPDLNNITAYNADIYFKGTSIFFGYQGGLSYKINELLGVYAGVRLVTVKNTYKGHIQDVMISADPADADPLYNLPAAGDYAPGDYLRAAAQVYGLPGVYVNLLNTQAAGLDVLTADTEVDVEETGTGFTPVLGANISLGDMVNIGLKYEFKTKLDLTTTVNDGKDAYGMFVQDSTVHSDMPAMLSAGVSVKALPGLTATAGLHYYFDKGANYGKTLDATGEQVTNDKVIDKNYFEIGVGLEYGITEKLAVSAGYLRAQTGVSEDYQSDLSFSLSSNTFGGGVGYRIIPNLMVNLGAAYTLYEDGEKNYTHILNTTIPSEIPVTQSYYKSNLVFGVGLDISF